VRNNETISPLAIDMCIAIAAGHHQAGRPEQAGQLCRQILYQQPGHPDALHLQGILAAQSGDLDMAVRLVRRVVQVRPDFVEAWRNLGCILVNQGKLAEALTAYRRLVYLRPSDAAAQYGLGIILRDQGHADGAIAAFSRAVQLRPDYAEAWLKLGMELRSAGRSNDAIVAYRRVIALKPDSADAHNNLANVLRDQGRLEEAIAEYGAAIHHGPCALGYLNLGNALMQGERFATAVQAFRAAARLQPDCMEAHNQMAVALANLHRFEEAMLSHRRAMALAPDNLQCHEALGATLLLRHDMVGAARSFRRALSLAPESGMAWNGLGMALRSLGRFRGAAACFRRALRTDPDNGAFHRNLLSIGRGGASAEEVERLRGLANRADLPVNQRVDAGFALGKLLDDADRFDEAFAAYAHASKMFRSSQAAAGRRFDPARLEVTVQRLIETFTPQFFAQRREWGASSDVPVFIVGMARSGTTLVEQIAASHPAVFGAGELLDMGRISTLLSHGGDRVTGQHWTHSSMARASQAHLAHLQELGGGASRVIDKMPGNLFLLGMIAVLFPAARVILCRRDARDTCLSCYFQHFAMADHHLYSYDVADCGRQYLETHRLVPHWREVLPLRLLEVEYEALIARPEEQMRRLIDFLGLPWDSACLDFYQTRRTITTASMWQVRQPLYSHAIGRWRRYERHLRPLLDVLAGSDAA
jgi:Flp pilus assembly protein TadD